MSTRYVVKQGDYLAKIARAHGYTDYNALWNAPENQGLRAKRKSPNVLYPGDNSLSHIFACYSGTELLNGTTKIISDTQQQVSLLHVSQ